MSPECHRSPRPSRLAPLRAMQNSTKTGGRAPHPSLTWVRRSGWRMPAFGQFWGRFCVSATLSAMSTICALRPARVEVKRLFQISRRIVAGGRESAIALPLFRRNPRLAFGHQAGFLKGDFCLVCLSGATSRRAASAEAMPQLTAIPDELRRELRNHDAPEDDDHVRPASEYRADRAVNRLACHVACASRTVANRPQL
jgi:hypothetical protein